jgi:hypothetical protein
MKIEESIMIYCRSTGYLNCMITQFVKAIGVILFLQLLFFVHKL